MLGTRWGSVLGVLTEWEGGEAGMNKWSQIRVKLHFGEGQESREFSNYGYTTQEFNSEGELEEVEESDVQDFDPDEDDAVFADESDET